MGRCHCLLQFCSIYPVSAQPVLHNETNKNHMCLSFLGAKWDSNGTCFLQPKIRTWHAVGRNDARDSPTRVRALLRNGAQWLRPVIPALKGLRQEDFSGVQSQSPPQCEPLPDTPIAPLEERAPVFC